MKTKIVLILIALVLFGCNSSGPKNDGKKVVKFWQFIAAPEYLNPIIAQFEKENPDIRIEMQQLTYDNGFEKIVTAIAAGTQPDLCEIGSTWLARFAYEGAINPVDSLVESLQDSLLMLDMVRYKNQYFGIPWMLGTRVLLYNKQLMADAGLDSSRAPQTWDELMQAAQKIHNPDKGIYGFSLAAGEAYSPWHRFIPFLWQFHGSVADADWKKCLLNNKQGVEALTYFNSFKPISIVDRLGQLDQLFTQGNLGFNISGSWNLALIPRNNPDLKFGIDLMPNLSKEEDYPISIAGGEVLIFLKISKSFEASRRFDKYLTKMENLLPIIEKQKNFIPAVKDGINHSYYQKHPQERLFFEQLLKSKPLPVHPYWTEIQEHFTLAVERVLLNNEEPKTVLDEVASEIDKILQRQ